MTAEAPVNNFFERAAFTIFFTFPAPTPVNIMPRTVLNTIAPANNSKSSATCFTRSGNSLISFLPFLSLSSKSPTAGNNLLLIPVINLPIPLTSNIIGLAMIFKVLNRALNNGIAFTTIKPIPPIKPANNAVSNPPRPPVFLGFFVGSKSVPSSSFLFSRALSFSLLLILSDCSLNIPALTLDKTNLSLSVSSILLKSFFIT